MPVNLKIDAGNRRIKWTFHEFSADDSGVLAPTNDGESGFVSSRSTDLTGSLVSELKDVPVPDAVWVSCVGSNEIRSAMQLVCTRLWNVPPVFLASQRRAGGVSNCYQDPETLGVDRWAALVGARSLFSDRPVVVVDAGTAVTVDYLDQAGEFRGGIIFPGLETMLEALSLSTGKLKERPAGWGDGRNPGWLNDNSADAVHNGVMLAAKSTVDCAISSHISRDHAGAEIVVTGGDADIIRAMSDFPMQPVPELVLFGVQVIGEEIQE